MCVGSCGRDRTCPFLHSDAMIPKTSAQDIDQGEVLERDDQGVIIQMTGESYG